MSRLASLVALLLLAAAVASTAAADRGKPANARVTAVDAAGSTIAAGFAWTPSGCEGVTLWDPGERDAWTFRVPRPCPATSTGRGIAAVAGTGQRVAFLSYAGGNTRDWRLWTATRTQHTPKLVRSASADASDPSPILLGNGDDFGIPYAVGRTVVVLNDPGRRSLTWTAPRDIAALNETGDRLAVTLVNGDVELVPTIGAPIVYSGVGARSAQSISSGVVYATASSIVMRRGTVTRVLTHAAGARLVSYVDGNLLYLLGSELHDAVWSRSTDIVLRHIPKPYLVDADRHSLVWGSGSLLCTAVFWNSSKPFPRYPGCSL